MSKKNTLKGEPWTAGRLPNRAPKNPQPESIGSKKPDVVTVSPPAYTHPNDSRNPVPPLPTEVLRFSPDGKNKQGREGLSS